MIGGGLDGPLRTLPQDCGAKAAARETIYDPPRLAEEALHDLPHCQADLIATGPAGGAAESWRTGGRRCGTGQPFVQEHDDPIEPLPHLIEVFRDAAKLLPHAVQARRDRTREARDLGSEFGHLAPEFADLASELAERGAG
jgi:hypothetical protein